MILLGWMIVKEFFMYLTCSTAMQKLRGSRKITPILYADTVQQSWISYDITSLMIVKKPNFMHNYSYFFVLNEMKQNATNLIQLYCIFF